MKHRSERKQGLTEVGRKLPMDIVPIGVVRQQCAEGEEGGPKAACIRVYPEFAEGLEGIEAPEHLTVLYWMHRLRPEDRKRLRVHPRGDPKRPKQGVFALRSPMRPNPIGLSTVKLVRRDGLDLYVKDLDALDGAPVIDIKYGRKE